MSTHAEVPSTSDSRIFGVHLHLHGVVPDCLLWLDTLTISSKGLLLTYELSPGFDLSAPRTWRWQCEIEDDRGTAYEDLASGGIELDGAGTRSGFQQVSADASLLALVISTPRTPDAPFGLEVATAVIALQPKAPSWAHINRERTAQQIRRWNDGERDERIRRRLIRKGLVGLHSDELTPLALRWQE